MKLLDLSDDNVITEEDLYEMARVKESDSGLPWIIFVSTKTYVSGSHWARIKVSNIPHTFSRDDNFSVIISKEPSVAAGKPKCSTAQLNQIFDWIKLNHDALMMYWKDQYSSDSQFYAELKKL